MNIMELFKTMDQAINEAAKNLPAGYVVKICIEKDGYNVEMDLSSGETVDSVDGGDGLRSDVWEAIQLAIADKSQNECDHDWEKIGDHFECTYPECVASKL
jgi:hypothetical protein|tara:strand:+ start:380 stop:682 length:303 start_codon:yes stop_codon:yes gene_type:complete